MKVLVLISIKIISHKYNLPNICTSFFIAYLIKKKFSYLLLFFSGNKFAMLEMKSIISAILRKSRLESICGKEQMIPKFRLTFRAQGGLWVKVKARDRCDESQRLA